MFTNFFTGFLKSGKLLKKRLNIEFNNESFSISLVTENKLSYYVIKRQSTLQDSYLTVINGETNTNVFHGSIGYFQ